MQIGREDIIWNYVATFLQIGIGVILFPFILRIFPQETVAIWTIFSMIIALSSLFDFGFNASFARNVSYVVSGVKKIKKNGFQIVENHNDEVDYALFKGLINAMRWFYGRIAFIVFTLLTTVGTYYIYTILKTYSENHIEVYISWAILCIINSYSLYTLYYDSLLQGQGFVKRAKQIQVVGQIIYLFVAIILILLRMNLIAIVSAQALSILVRRILSYRTIYTAKFKQLLRGVIAQSRKDIIKLIYPNAVKLGLTGVGGFLVTRSAVVIGSLYLSLNDIASYGITIQIIGIIAGLATVYFSTYQPRIAQYRIQNDKQEIKRLYLKSCLLLVTTYIVCGAILLEGGDWVLHLIGSKTPLLHKSFIALALLVSCIEANITCAGGFLLTKNEVPFFKAAIISGMCIVVGLFLALQYMEWGVMALFLIPLIVHISYQAWKWPWEVIKDLHIYRL